MEGDVPHVRISANEAVPFQHVKKQLIIMRDRLSEEILRERHCPFYKESYD